LIRTLACAARFRILDTIRLEVAEVRAVVPDTAVQILHVQLRDRVAQLLGIAGQSAVAAGHRNDSGRFVALQRLVEQLVPTAFARIMSPWLRCMSSKRKMMKRGGDERFGAGIAGAGVAAAPLAAWIGAATTLATFSIPGAFSIMKPEILCGLPRSKI
jgi:hypothetical protein